MNDTLVILGVTIFGPMPMLIWFYHTFGDRIKPSQIAIIIFFVYAFSVVTEVWLQNWLHIGGSTGVEGEDQGVKIALLVGVVVPMVYCGLFAMLNGSRTPPASARKASPNEGVGSMEWSEPPKGSSPSSAGVGSVQQTESRRISWTQVILPALIQAIGGIIVALIGALIGRSR